MTYWISVLRQTEANGTVKVDRLAVYEVDAWCGTRAIEDLKRVRPGLVMSDGREFLAIAPRPPNDGSTWERVEVAP